jgi:phage tail-like protein
VTFLDPMWIWYRSTLYGKPERRNGAIYLLDDVGVPTAWWSIENAWPTEWVGPRFEATETLVAIQSFTLVYEKITKSFASSLAGGAAAVLGKFV